LKIIEKALAKKEEKERVHKLIVAENAQCRLDKFRLESEIRRLKARVAELLKVQEEYSKLLTWSVKAENKIDALTEALDEMYD